MKKQKKRPVSGYKIKLFIGLVAFLVFAAPAYNRLRATESNDIFLTDDHAIYTSQNGRINFSYLVDPDGSMTIESLITNQQAFVPSLNSSPNFGFTGATYWIRVGIRNQANRNKRWLLELGYPFIDYISMFLVADNKVYKKEVTGRMRFFAEREFPHRNFVFKLKMTSNRSFVCFLKMRTSSNMSIPLSIQTTEAFLSANRLGQIAKGVFYGAILIMVLYNLLLLFSFKDITYLYYVLFLISIALVQLGLQGLSYEYFWPRAPWWNSKSFLFFTSLAMFAICLFEKAFLFTKKNNPFLHKVIIVLQIILLTLAFGSFIFEYSVMVKLVSFVAVISSVIMILTAFISLVSGYRAARFFILAWLAFLLGGTLLVLRNFGILPHTFLTINGMQIGIVLLIVFLSMALSERIVMLRKEHDHLMMLEKELSIARSVQTNIFPSQKYMDSIHGYEIDIKFFPMNKTVSGDYYNITLLQRGGVSLTVADASGHGMQAALTTMQIDLLCKESQISKEPLDRLNYMNNTWMEKEMSNNFFTCFIADLHRNKLVYASAGHPIQYLLRMKTRKLIYLQTQGQLIGFSPDATYEQKEMKVEADDILLLFSDGVVEVFNEAGEEYGEERLEKCLRRLITRTFGSITADMVNEFVLSDIEEFRFSEDANDDITMMAVRLV